MRIPIPTGRPLRAGATAVLATGLVLLSTLVTYVDRRVRRGDAGMTTAEYAVGTVAAVAFAVVLYRIVRSSAVSSALSGIIRSALHAI